MRVFRLILLTLLAFIVIAVGSLTYLLTQDLGRFKGPIERFVTAQTGRHFAIDGQLDLDLGRQARLLAENVSFGNPEWATERDMVRVGHAQIVVDLWSLFGDGRMVLDLVEIDDIQIALEVSDTGDASWTFGDDVEDEDETQPGLIPFVLRVALIENLRASYATPERPEPLQVRVEKFEQRLTEDGLLDASLTGTINERAVTVSGKYGPFDNLPSGENLEFDLTGQFDTLRITSSGQLDSIAAPREPDLKLRIEGPDIDDVTEMLGLPSLGDGLLDLTATVKPTDPGVNADIDGNLGPYRVTGAGRVEDLSKLENLSLGLNVDGPNLGRVMHLFGVPDIPEDPFDFSARVTRSGKSLDIDEIVLNFGGARFSVDGKVENFPRIYGTKLDLKVTGSDFSRFRKVLKLPVGASGPYEVTGQLEVSPDGQQLVDLRTKSNISELEIRGTVTEPPEFIGTRLKFSGQGANLAQFGDAYGIPHLLPEAFEIDGEIEIAAKGFDTQGPLQFRVGENEVTVDGRIGFRPLSTATGVELRARGPKLSDLAGMAGLKEGVPPEPFDVGGRVEVLDAGYRIKGASGTIGDASLTLDGTVSNAEGFAGSNISFSANVPDLRKMVLTKDEIDLPTGPVAAAGKLRVESDALRLDDIELSAAGAEATVEASVSLPFELPGEGKDTWGSAWGRFDIDARGPDLKALLPDTEIYRADASSFAVRAKGAWKNQHWTVDNATLEVADAVLNLNGEADEPPGFSDTDLRFDARVASLARLGIINGQRLPDIPFEIDTHFTGSPTAFTMDRLRSRFGESDLDGRFAARLDGEIPEIEIDIDSKIFDLTPLLALDDEGMDSEIEDGKPDDGRVIPDTPLSLEQLRKFNARVTIDADRFRNRKSVFDEFELHMVVKDGALNVSRFAGEGPAGKISASLLMEPVDENARIRIELQGSNLFLNLNERLTEEQARSAPRFDADINLEGRGLTVRQVAATLNGRLRITSGGGRTLNAGFTAVFGDFFNEVLSSINPFVKKEPYTDVSCIVALIDVSDGIATTAPAIVWQTDKMNIVSTGTIDLRNEKIDLSFKTDARKGLRISAGEFINPYLKVAGTMRRPQLTLDPTGTLVTGGAAVATAGLSILATAAWDRMTRTDDPCGAALAEAEKKWGN